MYLYYDKTRTLKSVISNDGPIRQNSDVNIFVCLDEDFFEDYNVSENEIEDSKISINVTYENKEIGVIGAISDINMPQLLDFKENDIVEMINFLENGKKYLVYKVKFSSNQISLYNGKIFLTIELYVGELNLTFADAELYVEERKGLSKYDNSIKIKKYNKILERLERIENIL